jgi:hypothetical protein
MMGPFITLLKNFGIHFLIFSPTMFTVHKNSYSQLAFLHFCPKCTAPSQNSFIHLQKVYPFRFSPSPSRKMTQRWKFGIIRSKLMPQYWEKWNRKVNFDDPAPELGLRDEDQLVYSFNLVLKICTWTNSNTKYNKISTLGSTLLCQIANFEHWHSGLWYFFSTIWSWEVPKSSTQSYFVCNLPGVQNRLRSACCDLWGTTFEQTLVLVMSSTCQVWHPLCLLALPETGWVWEDMSASWKKVTTCSWCPVCSLAWIVMLFHHSIAGVLSRKQLLPRYFHLLSEFTVYQMV